MRSTGQSGCRAAKIPAQNSRAALAVPSNSNHSAFVALARSKSPRRLSLVTRFTSSIFGRAENLAAQLPDSLRPISTVHPRRNGSDSILATRWQTGRGEFTRFPARSRGCAVLRSISLALCTNFSCKLRQNRATRTRHFTVCAMDSSLCKSLARGHRQLMRGRL